MSPKSESLKQTETVDADAEDGDALLQIENLSKHYPLEEGMLDTLLGSQKSVKAVDGATLSVESGETVAIVGESGCGKTTLGQTILNLTPPTSGKIRFKGDDITGLSDREMRTYRKDMQMIFQDPSASLNPRQTIGEILRTPMKVHGIGTDRQERNERAHDLLEHVGLSAEHLKRHPNQFSGGQQQRIGLARALTVEPDLIVADEPVSALDVSVQAQVLNRFQALQDEFGLSFIFIAHDLSVVRHVADRVVVMYLGQIVEEAPVDEIFDDPQHPYTKSLLSAVPRIDPSARTDKVVLSGTVPSPIDPPTGCRFHTRCPAIIPPDDWEGTQEEFRRAFSYRACLENGELDPEAVAKRLDTTEDTVDDAMIADRLLDVNLPGDLEDLPSAIASSLEEITLLLVDGQEEKAVDRIRDLLPSPCAGDEPKMVGEIHRSKCHRVGPDYEAGALLDNE